MGLKFFVMKVVGYNLEFLLCVVKKGWFGKEHQRLWSSEIFYWADYM